MPVVHQAVLVEDNSLVVGPVVAVVPMVRPSMTDAAHTHSLSVHVVVVLVADRHEPVMRIIFNLGQFVGHVEQLVRAAVCELQSRPTKCANRIMEWKWSSNMVSSNLR